MTGEEFIALLQPHLGERYVLGAVAPKNNPNWKGPWDCAELQSWGIYQLTKKLYGCVNDKADPAVADAYTGSFKYDSDKLGKIITVNEAAVTPGALLLRYSGGTIGHIVASKGTGNKTIEAHSTKMGVINHVIAGRRWDRGILIPWVTYKAISGVTVEHVDPKVYRWMKPMMTGQKVRDIQTALDAQGYHPGEIDGQYGAKTAQAVKMFQIEHELVADGEVGNNTAEVLGVVI